MSCATLQSDKKLSRPFLGLTLISESTWNGPTLTIRIRQSAKGRFVASFRKKGGIEDTRAEFPKNSTQVVSESFVASIMDLLAKVKIVPFPEMNMGCDGDFTTLKLGGYSGAATYRWWSVPPKEWKSLDQIANRIWSLFLKE